MLSVLISCALNFMCMCVFFLFCATLCCVFGQIISTTPGNAFWHHDLFDPRDRQVLQRRVDRFRQLAEFRPLLFARAVITTLELLQANRQKTQVNVTLAHPSTNIDLKQNSIKHNRIHSNATCCTQRQNPTVHIIDISCSMFVDLFPM